MTRADKGAFSAKYPKGSTPDPAIADAVSAKQKDGKLSCAAAHDIASDLSSAPEAVGRALDLMEIGLIKCQLGLFGYGPGGKRVSPADDIPENTATAIGSALRDNRISCKSCWEIADDLGISRQRVADICEAKNAKIKNCQLGAF